MKSVITAAVLATVAATASFAHSPDNVYASPELATLAQTGWADDFAAANGGLAFDETGGMPGMFTYDTPIDLSAARALLEANEFLAPHFAILPDGSIWVMVAPHLVYADGESYVDADGQIDVASGLTLMKGAGPDDNFIVIKADGSADRYDYSDDVATVPYGQVR